VQADFEDISRKKQAKGASPPSCLPVLYAVQPFVAGGSGLYGAAWFQQKKCRHAPSSPPARRRCRPPFVLPSLPSMSSWWRRLPPFRVQQEFTVSASCAATETTSDVQPNRGKVHAAVHICNVVVYRQRRPYTSSAMLRRWHADAMIYGRRSHALPARLPTYVHQQRQFMARHNVLPPRQRHAQRRRAAIEAAAIAASANRRSVSYFPAGTFIIHR
jgi:hypothetical protein